MGAKADGGAAGSIMSDCDWLPGGERVGFKVEEKKEKVESRTGVAMRCEEADSPIRSFLDCWGLFCTV